MSEDPYEYRDGDGNWVVSPEWEYLCVDWSPATKVERSSVGVKYRRKRVIQDFMRGPTVGQGSDERLGLTDPGKHYAFEYKGIRLDPYRIFKVSTRSPTHASNTRLRSYCGPGINRVTHWSAR
jgi:hypothetical protein